MSWGCWCWRCSSPGSLSAGTTARCRRSGAGGSWRRKSAGKRRCASRRPPSGRRPPRSRHRRQPMAMSPTSPAAARGHGAAPAAETGRFCQIYYKTYFPLERKRGRPPAANEPARITVPQTCGRHPGRARCGMADLPGLEPIQDLPARRLNGYFSNGLRAAYGGWPLDAPAGAVRPAALKNLAIQQVFCEADVPEGLRDFLPCRTKNYPSIRRTRRS